MTDFVDAHWFPLASQGNIYSMTKLCSQSGSNKILVASLKRKIYSCEFHITPQGTLKPLVKELLFTYIPSGAEIISIDAYNKFGESDGFVIGITITKVSTDSAMERYLNIYTEGIVDGEGQESSLIEAIAQNCFMVELSYTPYHLYHTILPQSDTLSENIWLISGNDCKIHLIREDKNTHGYSEASTEKYFPEFKDIKAVCLWISIYYYKDYKWRITVIGCDCGLVKIFIVHVPTLKVVHTWGLRYEQPVPSVIVFPLLNNVKGSTLFTKESPPKDKVPVINILVANTNNAVVFCDILHHGLDKIVPLSGSDSSDCILCSYVADVNMDGANEILLGTYGQELLIYTLINEDWQLTTRRLFDAPIHSMCYMDLTNDGIKELIVLTQRGVHILQHNTESVRIKWREKFRNLLRLMASEK